MGVNICVIWIAPSWRLLKQASDDFMDLKSRVPTARFGGDSDKLSIPEVSLDTDFDGVVLTTVQTYYRCLRSNRYQITASLLIWDECHWSQDSKMGRLILENCKQNNTRVLGLSATPLEDGVFYVAYHRSLLTLIEDGWLARPIIEEPIDTGIDWLPGIDFHGEFDSGSLKELSLNSKRNRLIAEHYNAHSHKFGQTLVFTCNIEHADLLVRAFRTVGVAVAPIHSGVPEDQRNQFLKEFSDKAIRVLVNVEMLTHGIDLPVVKTIFLCRPTTSEILFAQMIGRGTRKQKGKSDFYIVEFTDNVKKHIDLLITSKTYFSGAGSNRPVIDGSPDNSIRRKQYHGFDPEGLPTWIPEDPSLPPSIQGLWFRRGQTFGIEFELTRPCAHDSEIDLSKWSETATELLDSIRSVTDYVAEKPIPRYAGGIFRNGKDCSLWNVEYDSSVGWEVTSRILCDLEGYKEVDLVCGSIEKIISQLGLVINYKTGTHVHLGWNNQPFEVVRRLVRLVRYAEPALGTLIAPSRLSAYNGHSYDLNKPNEFCKPISWCAPESIVKKWSSITNVADTFSDRYLTLNLQPLFDLGTVEVRMHSGTIEAQKILLWLSLWQQILWAASVDRDITVTEDRKVIKPDGDILEFARTYLPNANEPSQASLLRRLDARRKEMSNNWCHNASLSEWVQIRRNWKAVD